MRTLKIVLTIFFPILLIYILSACEKDNKPDYESFLIKVDSVHIPENIVTNESFDIEFFGTVGTNGCFKFSKFKIERLDNERVIISYAIAFCRCGIVNFKSLVGGIMQVTATVEVIILLIVKDYY